MRLCSRKRPTIDLTRMFSDRPGTPGRRQQMPRTTRHHLHAGARRVVQQVDQRLVDQRVQLQPDAAPACRRARRRSRARISSEQHVPRGQRAEGERVHQFRPRVAGHVVEQPRRVARQVGIGGEERQVGVDARGDRVVVAGAEMRVGAHAAALAPHHQRQLGVRLQFGEADTPPARRPPPACAPAGCSSPRRSARAAPPSR